MFRKKDDLEEYYKERKKEKKYNKYEIELERKVLGKENHQIWACVKKSVNKNNLLW